VSEAFAFVRVVPLATHSSTATVGTPAPSFALANASGERIALADLVARGPVVLVFLRGFA
jgi:peroxiredoxin